MHARESKPQPAGPAAASAPAARPVAAAAGGPSAPLARLLAAWRADARVRRVAQALSAATGAAAGSALAPVRAGSLYGSSQALLAAALASSGAADPILVLAYGPDEADLLIDDLAAFLDPGPAAPEVLRFPAWEAAPAPGVTPSHQAFAERLRVLEALGREAAGPRGAARIVVAPIAALLQPVPRPEAVRSLGLRLRAGERRPPDEIGAALTAAGLTRVPLVELPGEWSIRGGVLDVYPLGAEEPLRIDYFGDDIESIRTFDPDTQRSLDAYAEVRIPLAPADALFQGAGALTGSLVDLVGARGAVVVCEPARVEGMAVELWRRQEATASAHPGGAKPLLAPTDVLGRLEAARRVEVTALPAPPAEAGVAAGPAPIDFGTRSVERASGADADRAVAGVRSLLAGGAAAVVVAAGTEGERARLGEILAQHGLDPALPEVPVVLVEAALGRGFEDTLGSPRLAVLTAHELFRRAPLRPRGGAPRRRRSSRPRAGGAPITSFLELHPGDLVVHVIHGIGRFLGIDRLDGEHGVEHLTLEYANDVKVYVPATKIELVQRYVGLKGHKPHLSVVGGLGWQKAKERAKRAVMDLAADLLAVQAARDLEQGTAFAESDHEQAAFEQSFPYEDTDDQREASRTIALDMARTRPMDRLVCGDVGYGKTELAMRAAFRAVRAKRQVAVLVPTTLLAEQHYDTFRDRMTGFDVRIACLNRFRKGREVTAILKALAAGEVDIVIGTHRLLSQDVAFRSLGLVVVDEEQRFGVAHKERLKRLRSTVDVLTMTATPIPRTLHMALLGIKDISSLTTAPSGRAAIRTVIAPARPELIREAILGELARDGQVFFVHNRVKTIEVRARELERLCPEARFAVGHGQMDEELLEDRMVAFLRHEVDVLVCTTIIESGLDIPRANTILIDRADHFGLAELHQLRGRVGRSHQRAYAYMLTPLHGRVSDIGGRRLKAIEEFSELGAGFQIAMRDLEIRGAGNLLGASQSGYICQIGYDLYCRLLAQAVEGLRKEGRVDRAAIEEAVGEEAAPAARRRDALERADDDGPTSRAAALAAYDALSAGLGAGVEIELGLEARLPERYVEDERQRLEMYRKLAQARDHRGIDAVVEEMEDRFGKLPQPARTLIAWTRVRAEAERLGVTRISPEGKAAVVRFRGSRAGLEERLKRNHADARWPEPGVCYIMVGRRPDPPPEEVLAALVEALRDPEAPRPVGERGRERERETRASGAGARHQGPGPRRRS